MSTSLPLKTAPSPAPQTRANQTRVTEVTTRAAWDQALRAHDITCCYTDWSWGAYKHRRGWRVRRLIVTDASGLTAICQVQTRKTLGISQHYIQGGPHLAGSGDLATAETAIQAIVDHLELRPIDVLVVNRYAHKQDEAALAMLASGFEPHLRKEQYTIIIELSQGADAVMKSMSSGWRKRLKAAQRHPSLTASIVTEPYARVNAMDTFCGIYDELKKRKGFSSSADMAALSDIFATDDSYVVATVALDGDVVCVGVSAVSNDSLVGLFAASCDRAKSVNANHLMLWTEIEYALARQLSHLDLGGIDPAGNPGVFDFKRSVSADYRQSDPLWCFSPTRLVRQTVPLLL